MAQERMPWVEDVALGLMVPEKAIRGNYVRLMMLKQPKHKKTHIRSLQNSFSSLTLNQVYL